MEQLASFIVFLYTTAGITLFFFNWFTLPLLLIYVIYRIVQLRDPLFEIRVSTPIHSFLLYYCGLIYGLLYPLFYYLAVRQRHALGPWQLGGYANQAWAIALGALCMTWMLYHLLEAALNQGRPVFRPVWTDRLFGALALLLCHWYHCWTIPAIYAGGIDQVSYSYTSPWGYFLTLGIFFFLYPQSAFFGTTLVYGSALLESLQARRTDGGAPPRRRGLALTLAAAAMLLLFSPFWLSVPRVSRNSALALIRQNKNLIEEISATAGHDPRLLAGIIYVAHTRDQPRWTGALLDQLSATVWSNLALNSPVELTGAVLNHSAGLCQIKPATVTETLQFVLPDSLNYYYSWLRMSGQNQLNSRRPPQLVYSPQTEVQARLSPFEPLIARLSQELGATTQPVNYPTAVNPPPVVYQTRPDMMQRLLLDERNNLTLAALMLGLLKAQWSRAGFSLEQRPEILATLYNLGYQRSKPHGAPRANDFGRRVKQFMESEACRELFPATGGP